MKNYINWHWNKFLENDSHYTFVSGLFIGALFVFMCFVLVGVFCV